VNIACRVDGLCKELRTPILLTSTTRDAVLGCASENAYPRRPRGHGLASWPSAASNSANPHSFAAP
jgi:hypothetical protein